MVEFDKEKEARLIKKATELVKQGWNITQISHHFGVDEKWLDDHVVFPKEKKPRKMDWFGDEADIDPVKKPKKRW